jgi:hypothetical protein
MSLKSPYQGRISFRVGRRLQLDPSALARQAFERLTTDLSDHTKPTTVKILEIKTAPSAHAHV